jgi:hypothetical protein
VDEVGARERHLVRRRRLPSDRSDHVDAPVVELERVVVADRDDPLGDRPRLDQFARNSA